MSATPRRWSFTRPAPPTSRWMPPSSRPPASGRNWCDCRSASNPSPTSPTTLARRSVFRRRREAMQLAVNGFDTFVATGGKDFDPALPAVVLLHGAVFDHSAWALHGRCFAHHGHSVLAPDLPGHGRTAGAPLT